MARAAGWFPLHHQAAPARTVGLAVRYKGTSVTPIVAKCSELLPTAKCRLPNLPARQKWGKMARISPLQPDGVDGEAWQDSQCSHSPSNCFPRERERRARLLGMTTLLAYHSVSPEPCPWAAGFDCGGSLVARYRRVMLVSLSGDQYRQVSISIPQWSGDNDHSSPVLCSEFRFLAFVAGKLCGRSLRELLVAGAFDGMRIATLDMSAMDDDTFRSAPKRVRVGSDIETYRAGPATPGVIRLLYSVLLEHMIMNS